MPEPGRPPGARVYVTTARHDVATRAYALKYLAGELATLGIGAIFAGRVPRTGHMEFDDVIRTLPQTPEPTTSATATDVHICWRGGPKKLNQLIPMAMHALRYAGHENLADELAAQGLQLLQRRRVTQRELLAFVGRYVTVDTGPTISRPAGYEASRLIVLRDAVAVLAILGGVDDPGVTAEIGFAAGLGRPVVVLYTDPRRADNPMLRHIVESSGGGCYWDHLSALARLHACVRPRRPRPSP